MPALGAEWHGAANSTCQKANSQATMGSGVRSRRLPLEFDQATVSTSPVSLSALLIGSFGVAKSIIYRCDIFTCVPSMFSYN